MKVLIVGGSRAVYFLCRAFTAKGFAVTVVNRDQEECVDLARRLRVCVVHGDGSEPDVLEEAGARGADIVLAITPNDQDNLVICQLAALRFQVPRVIATVDDPDNEEIFQKLGIAAFSTTRILASLIEQRAALEEIANLIPVGQGKVNLTEIVLRQNSPMAGKQLAEAALPEEALIACILRDQEPIIPRGRTQLIAGDRLILITLPENHGRAIRAITGDER